MKPRVAVRAFGLLLSFDSVKQDAELELEAKNLVEKINFLLKREFPGPLPQLELEEPKKRLKIGIKKYTKKELDEI